MVRRKLGGRREGQRKKGKERGREEEGKRDEEREEGGRLEVGEGTGETKHFMFLIYALSFSLLSPALHPESALPATASW